LVRFTLYIYGVYPIIQCLFYLSRTILGKRQTGSESSENLHLRRDRLRKKSAKNAKGREETNFLKPFAYCADKFK
jgi:hypothetical protein